MDVAHQAERVGRAVDEIGFAEGDVLGSGLDLVAYIFDHDVARQYAEPTVIDGNDRAVPTAVPDSPETPLCSRPPESSHQELRAGRTARVAEVPHGQE